MILQGPRQRRQGSRWRTAAACAAAQLPRLQRRSGSMPTIEEYDGTNEEGTSLDTDVYTSSTTSKINSALDKRRTKKLRQKYYGPFEVLQQTSPVSFKLRLPAQSNLFPIFHANLLLPATGVDMHGKTRQALPAVSSKT